MSESALLRRVWSNRQLRARLEADEADSGGSGSPVSFGEGPPVLAQNQDITVLPTGAANTSGTFRLQYPPGTGPITGPISFDATEDQIAAALAALPTIGEGNCIGLPPYGDAVLNNWIDVLFVGALGNQLLPVPGVVDDTTDHGVSTEMGIEGATPNPVDPTFGDLYVDKTPQGETPAHLSLYVYRPSTPPSGTWVGGTVLEGRNRGFVAMVLHAGPGGTPGGPSSPIEIACRFDLIDEALQGGEAMGQMIIVSAPGGHIGPNVLWATGFLGPPDQRYPVDIYELEFGVTRLDGTAAFYVTNPAQIAVASDQAPPGGVYNADDTLLDWPNANVYGTDLALDPAQGNKAVKTTAGGLMWVYGRVNARAANPTV